MNKQTLLGSYMVFYKDRVNNNVSQIFSPRIRLNVHKKTEIKYAKQYCESSNKDFKNITKIH